MGDSRTFGNAPLPLSQSSTGAACACNIPSWGTAERLASGHAPLPLSQSRNKWRKSQALLYTVVAGRVPRIHWMFFCSLLWETPGQWMLYTSFDSAPPAIKSLNVVVTQTQKYLWIVNKIVLYSRTKGVKQKYLLYISSIGSGSQVSAIYNVQIYSCSRKSQQWADASLLNTNQLWRQIYVHDVLYHCLPLVTVCPVYLSGLSHSLPLSSPY